MRGLLVRVGIDQKYGGWNAPCFDDRSFCYVPMQPKRENPDIFEPGFETTYNEFEETCYDFAQQDTFVFPVRLQGANCHLDPDFRFFSYGDSGQRARRILTYFEGSQDNFIAFYASFTPIDNRQQSLNYAIFGLYRFENVLLANTVHENIRNQNAHTRLANYQDPQNTDIVIFANHNNSGRLRYLLPIGERRNNRQYYVRNELLQCWGGINVRNGWIQRNVSLPNFCNPEMFLQWFYNQNPEFVYENNIIY